MAIKLSPECLDRVGAVITGRRSALMGCGSIVSDALHVVISYRRSDSPDTTGRIYDRLVDAYGCEHVFKDVDSIPFEVDFREHLGLMVGQCGVLIATIGDGWLNARNDQGFVVWMNRPISCVSRSSRHSSAAIIDSSMSASSRLTYSGVLAYTSLQFRCTETRALSPGARDGEQC